MGLRLLHQPDAPRGSGALFAGARGVMRILHVASEVAPYSKTGGLGDVLSALPGALARLGFDVTVVTPRYGSIDPERFGLARWLRRVAVPLSPSKIQEV